MQFYTRHCLQWYHRERYRKWKCGCTISSESISYKIDRWCLLPDIVDCGDFRTNFPLSYKRRFRAALKPREKKITGSTLWSSVHSFVHFFVTSVLEKVNLKRRNIPIVPELVGSKRKWGNWPPPYYAESTICNDSCHPAHSSFRAKTKRCVNLKTSFICKWIVVLFPLRFHLNPFFRQQKRGRNHGLTS